MPNGTGGGFLLYNSEIQNAFYRLQMKKIKFFSIGRTALGKHIMCTHLGNKNGKQIVVFGGTHAREYITTLLVCKMIEFYSHVKFDGGIYFIPLLNPDGVDICINGTENVDDEFIKNYLNEHVQNFSQFKANANLVDINVNFPARWGEGKKNVKEPNFENFIGFLPASENETRAVMSFLKKISPDAVISYHSKGEEIYYNFDQDKATMKQHFKLAKIAKELTGYKIKKLKGSVGGLKDWCIHVLKIPALTIEVGSDRLPHPIRKQNLPKIFQQNFKLPLLLFENI